MPQLSGLSPAWEALAEHSGPVPLMGAPAEAAENQGRKPSIRAAGGQTCHICGAFLGATLIDQAASSSGTSTAWGAAAEYAAAAVGHSDAAWAEAVRAGGRDCFAAARHVCDCRISAVRLQHARGATTSSKAAACQQPV